MVAGFQLSVSGRSWVSTGGIDGFRGRLLHRRLPGKLFKRCSVKIHPPLDLESFYAEPYRKERGAEVLASLEAMIGEPA